nr:helicase-related protein [uncultured Desulfobulbus sp.]
MYQLMSRLRSSRAAVVEHLLGTTEAAQRFQLEARIKTEDTGNVLKTLEEISGQVKQSSLEEKLPVWLTNSDEHRKAVSDELDIYKRILDLIERISGNREQYKAEQLSNLLKTHPLLLAFDSCLISLEVIKQLIFHQNTGCKVIVATGSQVKSKKEVNKLFSLGSNAEGVIALCSDAMSEGLNLQQASAVVLLDMPSVIRVAEQRVGRVDRMNSPHKAIEVWWPLDSDAFALKTDRKFFQRYTDVRDILGSNLDLPENLIPEEIVEGPDTVEEMVSKLAELDQKGTSWDGIQDAFQPVRDLVDPENGIVPIEVYNQVRHSKARVLSSVSLVKAKKAWAFFAILGADYGAPKWIFFDHPAAYPLTHLEEVASRLREVLSGDIENRTMDAKASLLIEKFLEQVLATERFLLPRKKQRALAEMKLILDHYVKTAQNQENWEAVELLGDILKFTDPPKNDEDRPDLDTIAEIWLDLTRDAWYEKLLSKRRYKPLRLKDIRKSLQQNPLGIDVLREAFSNIRQSQPLNSRVISAIIGVP